MLSAPNQRHRVASRFALMGGLVQIGVAFSILFLPVLGICRQQAGSDLICERQSYLQGGNSAGYAILLLIGSVGILAVVTRQAANYKYVKLIRWLGALSCSTFVVIYLWSFGITFVPGALLLLLSALLT